MKLGEKAFIELKQNGRNNKKQYKDGRSGCRKFKLEKCQRCESTEHLEIHHIQPVVYSENYSRVIAGNHSPDNLITLCNSCHQKEHYRKLGRKHKVKHNVRNGRFVKNAV